MKSIYKYNVYTIVLIINAICIAAVTVAIMLWIWAKHSSSSSLLGWLLAAVLAILVGVLVYVTRKRDASFVEKEEFMILINEFKDYIQIFLIKNNAPKNTKNETLDFLKKKIKDIHKGFELEKGLQISLSSERTKIVLAQVVERYYR